MSEYSPKVPALQTPSEILEAAAGLVGVALYRGRDNPQQLYDDLGALLSIIMGARTDLARKVKAR